MTTFVGVLFDGIAYGSLLFLISVGLSVTMGLMNFVNLAHGAFAMLGGYACVVAMNRLGVPFLAALPIAFVVSALVGAVLERTLYQRLYRATHLDQVLFSIGLVLMSIDPATRDVVQTVYLREVKMVNGQPWNVEFDKIENVGPGG